MSWNHFPILQPLLLDSLTSSFQAKTNFKLNISTPAHLKSPQNNFRKAKTSKVIDISSNEDNFQQLLKKMQKVTHEFKEDHSVSSTLTFSVPHAGLTFDHTIKALLGKKNQSKSTRRIRTMKSIDVNNDDHQQYNNMLAQTSPAMFTSPQNKSQKLIHFKVTETDSMNVKFAESVTQLHNPNIKNKQNLPISSLKSSQQTKFHESPEKIKKINFDLNILDKAPIRQSIYLDNLEDFMFLQGKQSLSFENVRKEGLKISDFELGNCVGSGKFGQVYICKHKKTSFICALKKIMKSTIEQYKMVDQLIRQLKISYMVDHPNFINTYGHFHDEFHIFLLMQYAGDGCLIDNLQEKKGQQLSSNVLLQTLNAIDHLHKNRIVHRDLKPQNIVVCFKDTYKLCDFGLSAFVNNDMKHTFCGTPDYLSPEMKDIGEYDFSVDLWSLGILAYELIIGEAPFKDKISEWKKSGWKKSSYWTWKVEYPKEISTLAKEFMQGLLKEKPQERASIWSCLQHELIKKHASKEIDIIKMAQVSD